MEPERQLPAKTRAMIKWENGMPVPYRGEILENNQLVGLQRATLSLPYKPRMIREVDDDTGETKTYIDPDEIEFLNMSCAEVAAVRIARSASHGDLESQKYIMDRLIGKPKQLSENINLNANISLQSALDMLSDEYDKHLADKEIHDLEILEPDLLDDV